MNKRKIALGPGASSLILIVVVLSLCMLAMLTMISARNDSNLSIRSAESIKKVYQMSSDSEVSLAKLDQVMYSCQADHLTGDEYLEAVADNLPDGMEMDEDLVCWTEGEGEGRYLECSVRILPAGEDPRYEWVTHRLLTDEAGEEFDE